MIAFSNRELFSRMLFNPYVIYESNQYYRFITYGLLHANWVHLLINMFVLYSFGDFVENAYTHFFPVLGRYYYILLYIFGLVLSVVPSYSKHKNDQWYASVGASGAVSAVIFSSIIINPLTKKTLFEIFDSEKRSEYLKIIQQCKTDVFEIRIKDRMGATIKFSAVNILTEYKGKMIKLLAMKDPVFY